ncbi:MAG TPA: Gfo/Idh/MocA family oxidoreductase [Thermoanaerobaculia bacterium]|nr:Gfo/Idh/MocA family oxidoreductase [Thermoanaerobaculia bacterium]
MARNSLGVGFIGSGFITRFHLQSWVAVRDADVLGVWSPNPEHAASAAHLARSLGVGDTKPYDSIADLVADPAIDALWICGPNHQRVANMTEIAEAVLSGKGELRGVACEKPLGRNLAEATRMVALAREAKLLDGYLENQVFSPAVVRGRQLAWSRGAQAAGRPYLARAAEEHSGPHNGWFWQADLQGGGVLNDMMCHSVEVARYLLTEPGRPRDSIVPRRICGQIACLKWQRPPYIAQLRERYGESVDYLKRPAEDFARVLIDYQDDQDRPLVVEATTSWSYVGAGLRLSMELLGPEYSMRANSLDTELELFFSRAIAQSEGEDLIEKQNAETGVMPVVPEESAAYGYDGENRHMVQSFLAGARPRETFDDGLEVTRLLMAAYKSAEEARTLELPIAGLEDYVPAVARGEWNPREQS